jgi:beta-glucosidase
VEAWQGGEEAGTALARLLWGDADFSAALPVTVVTAAFAAANDFTNMSMRAFPGRTHRFVRDDGPTPMVLYSFGHGLSYASWAFEGAALSAAAISRAALLAGGSVTLSALLRNTGAGGGGRGYEAAGSAKAVLGFACRVGAPAGWPVQWLVGYTKVHSVLPASAADVQLAVGAAALEQRWSAADGSLALAAGTYRLWLGGDGSCADSKLELRVTA